MSEDSSRPDHRDRTVHRANRLRTILVGGAAAASLSLAAVLGISGAHHSSAAGSTVGSSSGSSGAGGQASTSTGTSTGTGTVGLSSGSGSAHATTSGS